MTITDSGTRGWRSDDRGQEEECGFQNGEWGKEDIRRQRSVRDTRNEQRVEGGEGTRRWLQVSGFVRI